MKRYPLFLLLPVWGILLQSHVAADVLFHRDVPQVAFAAAELSDAMTETGRDNLTVTIVIDSAQSNPEAFQIRVAVRTRSRSLVLTPTVRCTAALKSLNF